MADIKKLIEHAIIFEGLLRNIEAQNGRQFPEYISLLNEKFEELQEAYYEMFPPNKLFNENHSEDEAEVIEIVDVDEEETAQSESPAPQPQQQWRTNTVPLSKPQPFPTAPIAAEAPQQQMPPQPMRQTPMPGAMPQQMPPQPMRQTPMPGATPQQMPPQPMRQTPMPGAMPQQMPPQPMRQTPMPGAMPQQMPQQPYMPQQMPQQPFRNTPMPQQQMPPQMPANMIGSQQQPPRVDEVLSQHKAENLSKAFTINDKYRFGRDLYYSNNELMNEQIKAAQNFSNYQQAYDLFVTGNKWNPESPVVQEFMAIISRHFQQQ